MGLAFFVLKNFLKLFKQIKIGSKMYYNVERNIGEYDKKQMHILWRETWLL